MILIKLYSKLIGFYPKSFQRDYGEDMLLTLHDMVNDQPSKLARAVIWLRAFAELPVYALRHNAHVIEHIYATDTPVYVKRSAQASALLIFPFIMLLVVNELKPHALPSTPNWTDIYQVLAFVLPTIAFLLCVLAMSYWRYTRRAATAKSKSIADIRHNWPVVLVGSFALLIVVFMAGHDGARCITRNPVKVVHNPRATLQCIEKD